MGLYIIDASYIIVNAPHGSDGIGATTNRQKNWQSSSSLKYFMNLGNS